MRTLIFAIAMTPALLVSPAHASSIEPVLTIARGSAPVRVDVPYTITVAPKKKAVGKRARIQVKGILAWRGFDTFRIPKSGVIGDDVEGYNPGVGKYRVLILGRNGKVLAKSNVVAVTWTARTA